MRKHGEGVGKGKESRTDRAGTLQGIVVANGNGGGASADPPEPRITAFIWGGKVRPSPTLPFGRWKGAA